MATINSRLLALEQIQSRSCPMLVMVYLPEQGGIPTPEQAMQIEQAKKKGQTVNIINIVCAEDLFHKKGEK